MLRLVQPDCTYEIPVAHSVHAVFRYRSKAQSARQFFSINVERISRNCTRSERHDVNTFPQLLQSLAIGLHEETVGKQPVAESNRLRSLEFESIE